MEKPHFKRLKIVYVSKHITCDVGPKFWNGGTFREMGGGIYNLNRT